jgi:hypothetical protein
MHCVRCVDVGSSTVQRAMYESAAYVGVSICLRAFIHVDGFSDAEAATVTMLNNERQ